MRRTKHNSQLLLCIKNCSLSFIISFVMLVSLPLQAATLTATWDPNSESDLAGYKVYYGTESGSYSTIEDVGNTTSYVARDLVAGQEYFFVVTAYDESGNESEPSVEVSAMAQQNTTEITATLTNENNVLLSWREIPDADSYEIYKSSDPYSFTATPLQTVQALQYTDQSVELSPNNGIYYKVKALQNSSEIYPFDPVGVFTISLNKGFNLVSVPLFPADSSLATVFGTQLTGGQNASTADRIMFVKDDYQLEVAWLVEGTTTAYEGKWMDASGSAESSLQVNPNSAFWIQVRPDHADTLVTVSGVVPMSAERHITLAQGLNFVGSCYPVPVTLHNSELQQDGVVQGGTNSSASDLVMDWDVQKYNVAWLVSGTNTEFDGKWMDNSGNQETSIQFEPGQGYVVYIKGERQQTEWTYPNPNQQ